jgi:hypothetical protein
MTDLPKFRLVSRREYRSISADTGVCETLVWLDLEAPRPLMAEDATRWPAPTPRMSLHLTEIDATLYELGGVYEFLLCVDDGEGAE